jgi:hypothetical protein
MPLPHRGHVCGADIASGATRAIVGPFLVAAMLLPAMPAGAKSFGEVLNRIVIGGGNVTQKAVQDTGKTVEKAAHDTGKTVEKAAHDTGKTVEKAAHDTGKTLEKAAHDVGHGIEGAGQYVGKHPWETVVAITLIAGGGYLIAYGGYTLAITAQDVTIVSISSGTTSGIIAGSALSAGGAAVEFLPAAKSRGSAASDAPSTPLGLGNGGSGGNGSTGTPITMTYTVPVGTAPSGNILSPVDPQRSGNASAGGSKKSVGSSAMAGDQSATAPVDMTAVDGAYKESMLAWPWMQENPGKWGEQRLNWEKLRYATRVMGWAERVQPLKDFDPAKLPQLTQAEQKILDALIELDSIKDSKGHKLAVENAEEVEKPIQNFILDQARDKVTEKTIEYIIGETAVKYYGYYGWVKMAIAPVPIVDDDMLMRDFLKKALSDQFQGYLNRRLQYAEQTQGLDPRFHRLPPWVVEFPGLQNSQTAAPLLP